MTLLIRSFEDGVLTLRLNRPEARNAINDEMMLALLDSFDAAGNDDSVRVIVVDGAGEHFCGGADIVARNAGEGVKPRAGSIQRRMTTQVNRLIPQITRIQVPVVCKVRGYAVGIGFSLALAADFCVAASDARFWEPFATRGFTADSGATWLLPRRVGEVRARELLLLARELSGAEAAEWGIIHQAVAPTDLDTATSDLVARLAAGPTVTLGLTKWLLAEGAASSLPEHLPNEAFAMELSSRSEDFREGMAAFREKRAPHFGGR
jgi:2-(1,2-epoxy-1,2-dihydrophenyl)acetyl-CoA isomerase